MSKLEEASSNKSLSEAARFALIGVATLAAGMLSACSVPPSSVEVDDMVRGQMDRGMAFGAAMSGSGDLGERPSDLVVERVTRDGCERNGDHTWRCVVTVTMKPGVSLPLFGSEYVTKYDFTKMSDGWYAEEVM